MKSIRSKLLLIIIPILTISLVGIAWINHSKATDFLVQNFQEKSAVDIAKLSGELDSWLQVHIARLSMMSTSQQVVTMDQRTTITYFKEIQKELPEYSTFLYALPNGESYTSLDQKTNIADRAYFKDIMAGKPYAISDVLIHKVTGDQIIVIACPVKDENGKLKGVFGATIAIKTINELVGKGKYGETGYATLVQKDGTFIAHPKAEFVMKNKMQDLGVPELAEAQQKLSAGKGDQTRYTLDGIEKFAFYSVVPTTGWGVIITAPVDEATSQLKTMAIISFVTAAVVLAFAVIVVTLFTTSLIKPIKLLTNLTTQVADGDLTIKLQHKSKDEVGVLGQNFNEMIHKMQGVLTLINKTTEHTKRSSDTLVHSSEETKQSAEQVARTISELASGTSDIAASVTNATDKINEIMVTVNKISQYANEIIDASRQSKQSAATGRGFANQAVQKMSEIDQTVKQTADIINRLDHHSKEIGNIVGMITNIAQQTNLLALNASIEAARAGDHGKGFAVVAEEVRKLANETSISAEKISSLIKETQNESHRAVEAVELGTRVVEEGTNTVQEAGSAFVVIEGQIDNVLEKNVSIHQSIQDLERMGRQVVGNMEDISAVTEEAAAGSEEVSAASEEQAAAANQISIDALELAKLADELQVIMAQFKVEG
ncbi:methyl-accepting chemotaxis protein [Brevibacillus sp. SYSU BS000544]|uniref:methyl-accepting chemotaxis protein n=1 Tax=Brevibacillus sp. SYSU BS000544 TaxID=3416443 RepID=UPI003CE53BE8